jgi:hypothetical protein
MLNKAKNLKIRRIKLGIKLSFIIKFDVCIDLNKHQTYRKNFNFIKKNIMLYEFDAIKHIKNF